MRSIFLVTEAGYDSLQILAAFMDRGRADRYATFAQPLTEDTIGVRELVLDQAGRALPGVYVADLWLDGVPGEEEATLYFRPSDRRARVMRHVDDAGTRWPLYVQGFGRTRPEARHHARVFLQRLERLGLITPARLAAMHAFIAAQGGRTQEACDRKRRARYRRDRWREAQAAGRAPEARRPRRARRRVPRPTNA